MRAQRESKELEECGGWSIDKNSNVLASKWLARGTLQHLLHCSSWCFAARCSMLQRVAVFCSVLQYFAMLSVACG